MKHGLKMMAAMAVVGFLTSSCYHFRHSAGTAQKSVSMQPSSSNKAKPFKVQKNWTNMWMWGLVGKDVQVDQWIANEIGNGKSVSNMKLETQMSFLNGLANLVSFGIYSPQTVTITGEYQ